MLLKVECEVCNAENTITVAVSSDDLIFLVSKDKCKKCDSFL